MISIEKRMCLNKIESKFGYTNFLKRILIKNHDDVKRIRLNETLSINGNYCLKSISQQYFDG